MDEKLLRILGNNTELYPHALEKKYPRIFTSILQLWDSPQMEGYLGKLMVNERNDREGFPPDVAAEIMHLSLIHASQHQKVIKDDIWGPEARMFTAFDPQASIKHRFIWPDIPRETANAIQALEIECSLEGYFRAAESGNQTVLGMFLDAGVHTETVNENGWTALMSAVFNGHTEATSLLIQKGAQTNATESGGNTPLHWAASAGKLLCCQLLVENHAAIDPRSNFGWTPFYQAVARNHLLVATYLIAAGANINASGKDGLTPLHKAAANGSVEMIRLLLRHKADAYLTSQTGDTPLSLAMKNFHDNAAALLKA